MFLKFHQIYKFDQCSRIRKMIKKGTKLSTKVSESLQWFLRKVPSKSNYKDSLNQKRNKKKKNYYICPYLRPPTIQVLTRVFLLFNISIAITSENRNFHIHTIYQLFLPPALYCRLVFSRFFFFCGEPIENECIEIIFSIFFSLRRFFVRISNNLIHVHAHVYLLYIG